MASSDAWTTREFTLDATSRPKHPGAWMSLVADFWGSRRAHHLRGGAAGSRRAHHVCGDAPGAVHKLTSLGHDRRGGVWVTIEVWIRPARSSRTPKESHAGPRTVPPLVADERGAGQRERQGAKFALLSRIPPRFLSCAGARRV